VFQGQFERLPPIQSSTQTKEAASEKKLVILTPMVHFYPAMGLILLMDADFEPQNSDSIVGLRKNSIEHPGSIIPIAKC